MRTSQQVEALDILGQLTKHYIAALATQAQLQLSHEANEFGKALVATITKRVKRGAAPQTELIRAQAALAQIRIRSLGFKQQLLREKAELAIFWGNPLEKTPPLSGDLYVFAHARPLEELQAQLLESPAVAQLISSERLQNSSIALQKTQNAADITWSMGIRRLQQSADSAFTFGLSVPLGSHSRNNSQLRATQADALALRSYNNEQRLRLQQQLFAAYSQRQQFLDAFALLRDEVIPLLTQALALTREAYDRGRLSYQDLHIAQQELLSARHQKINTAKTVLLNQALVEQLTAQPLTL
jgi:Outer membrane protein